MMAKAKQSLAQSRETGSQKSGLTCPNCGSAVPAVTSEYGSVSSGACPKCWPEASASQLEAQVAAAKKASGDSPT